MGTARSDELRALAQRVAEGLPAFVEEVVLTGSVSRGMADDRSDIEMLVVPAEPLTLEEAFAASGLPRPETWGPQGTPARRVFGYVDAVPSSRSGGRASSPRSTSRRTSRPRRSRTACRCAPSGCWNAGRRT